MINPWTGNKIDQENYEHKDSIDWGKLTTVFMVCSIISLTTSWFYSLSDKKLTLTSDNNVYGPIEIKRPREPYNIFIKTDIPAQHSVVIEGEVLNEKKEPLFSFGEELWHEEGRDSDGYWRDIKNSYDINITFPLPGNYYVKFIEDGPYNSAKLSINITKKNGSALPHFWFGIFTLLIGVFLNELKNKTIKNLMSTPQ